MTDVGPPKVEIVIVQKQTIDVRADAVERLARLLAKADGVDPDLDWRYNDGMMLTVNVGEPFNRNWSRYRDKAEDLLKKVFTP